MRDLRALLSQTRREISKRQLDEGNQDPELLAQAALQSLFTETSVGAPKVVAPGVLALGGQVQEHAPGSTRHKCQLFTVLPDGEGSTEMWAWDDSIETFMYSETAKVATRRRSVALHAVTEGAIVVRHSMTHDGFRHNRTAVAAWRVSSVDDDGNARIEQLSGWVPSTLPLSHDTSGDYR
ncbi:MAG TPA: hypothetical protein VFC06_03905 [Demequina sp.]|nr:hypothetical protein [Demequina sp.]